MRMVTFTKAIGSMTSEPVAESVVLRTGTSTKAVSATIYAMAMASRRTVVKDPTNEVRQRTLGSGPMAFAVALAARLIATALRMRVSGIMTNATDKAPCNTQTERRTLVSGKMMNDRARVSTPWPTLTSTRATSCTTSTCSPFFSPLCFLFWCVVFVQFLVTFDDVHLCCIARRYHGEGVMVLKDGTTYTGAWRSGKHFLSPDIILRSRCAKLSSNVDLPLTFQ